MRTVGGLLFALFVVGCVGDQAAPVAVVPSFGTIAVITSIEPKLRISATGLTVFENSLEVINVSDWRLDEVAAAAATRVLSPRYRVVHGSVDAFVAEKPLSKLDVMLGAKSDIGEQLRDHARTDGSADMILLIYTAPENDQMDQAFFMRDIGISKERHILRTLAPAAHTLATVALVDAKTFRVVARSPLRDHGGIPAEPIDGFEWNDHWSDMGESQHRLAHDRIVAILSRSVADTLRDVGLAN